MTTDYAELHARVLSPCVRIQADRASGSGTVLYAGDNGSGGTSCYILTNHHVIADLISVEKKFDPKVGKDVKKENRKPGRVEFFQYRYSSRFVGESAVDADVMAYDEDEDLALLKLRADSIEPKVATLFPRGKENELRIGMPIYTVGAGLGERPVTTIGILSQFNIPIEGREYWLCSAPSIYGNSGGATFLQDTLEFVGVPSRIAVRRGFLGITSDAITHISYSIPVTRVYDFLADQGFAFVFDPEHTEAGDAEERENAKKASAKDEDE